MGWTSYRHDRGVGCASFLGTSLALCVLGAGCSSVPTEPVSLVDHSLWSTNLEASEDPFDDRPQEVTCSELSYGQETTGGEENFEVDTTRCDYLTVAQPSLAPVAVGDTLHLRLWHFDLTAEEPAEAHAALRLGDEVLWEERIAIPNDATLLNPTWEAEHDFEEGEPLYFHLHNHGQNSWNLIELTVGGS